MPKVAQFVNHDVADTGQGRHQAFPMETRSPFLRQDALRQVEGELARGLKLGESYPFQKSLQSDVELGPG